MKNIIPSMLLISGTWNGAATFKMIPATNMAPYNEIIYDPNSKALAIVGTAKKDQFHMMDRLLDNGDPKRATKPRTNGNPFEQQRVTMESFYEYYIIKADEIESFVNAVAVNAADFNFKELMVTPEPETAE